MAALPNNQQKADKRIIGFDCEFVKPPPSEYVQSQCPITVSSLSPDHLRARAPGHMLWKKVLQSFTTVVADGGLKLIVSDPPGPPSGCGGQ